VTAVQNIVKCVHRCGLEVVDLVLQPLASGYAVLTEDEKDVGVCLVDIGGGTTDVAVFVHGAIRHTAVIPIAGDQLTNDIAIALRTSTQDAEDIKIRYGVALQQLADPEEMIEVPGVGDRPSTELSRQTLAGFIQPRVEEIFQKVQEELQRSGKERLLRAGRGADRRRGADARHGRAGRGDFSQYGEVGDAALRRQLARFRAQPAPLHRHGFVVGRRDAAAAGHEGTKSEKFRAGSGTDEGVVHAKFLRQWSFSGGKHV
jgi:hypothetical protein